MMRLLFLPVTRYVVKYIVAVGRPFSELDRLVLRAIKEKKDLTVDDLKDMFKLPQRPLLENLVTLFHAGWIAMNSQGRFVPTDEGINALDLRTLPVSMRTLPPRSLGILVETLSGMCVAAGNSARYYSRRELKDKHQWKLGRAIEPVVTRSLPDQGVVRSLARARRDEWIHSIGEPQRRGAYYLRVLVDPEEDQIVGLPERWQLRLAEMLFEEARTAPVLRELADEELPKPFSGGRFPDARRAIMLRESDIVTTAEQHREVLRQILELAPPQSWIAIAGETIDPRWLQQEWGEKFVAALRRGVSIDLLWRTIKRTDLENTGTRQLGDFVAAVNEAAGNQPGRGVLRANDAASRSRARYIFAVPREPDEPHAWIGGWEWLAPVEGWGVSVCVRDLTLMVQLAETTAALLDSAASTTLSAMPEVWKEIAGSLECRYFLSMLDADPAGNCEVQLLRDREIDRTIAEIVKGAAQLRIRTRSEGEESPLLQRFRERIAQRPVPATIETSDNAAEAIVTDRTVIVSSAPVSGVAGEAATLSDVGLAIYGGPAVDALLRSWASNATPS